MNFALMGLQRPECRHSQRKLVPSKQYRLVGKQQRSLFGQHSPPNSADLLLHRGYSLKDGPPLYWLNYLLAQQSAHPTDDQRVVLDLQV